MAITIRGTSDKGLRSVRKALSAYAEKHPDAEIELYRRNSISVRIRVIDPVFADMGMPERHERIWEHLETLPDEIQSDISMLVTLAPEEAKRSMANLEFEDPSPSIIK